MKTTLDFICIGAAKSGTTTLFELMKHHPQLAMPTEKEVPFFSNETVYAKGLAWYMRTYFSGASKKDILRGTITPQYMLGEDATAPKIIADRIKDAAPNTKLIVILRHPIERAYSHYKMSAQRGHLSKSFDQAVEGLLSDMDQLDKLRETSIDITNNFLLGSEYGHELKPYYDLFDKKQILVLFTDELKKDPQATVDKVFEFLGVEHHTPPAIGQEFRKGGGKAKIPLLKPGVIYKIPFVKTIWQNYTPYSFRKRVEYSINLWNIKPDNDRIDRSSSTYRQLVDFYREDVSLLEKLTKTKVPWSDWH